MRRDRSRTNRDGMRPDRPSIPRELSSIAAL
jgi:hypothetical protein